MTVEAALLWFILLTGSPAIVAQTAPASEAQAAWATTQTSGVVQGIVLDGTGAAVQRASISLDSVGSGSSRKSQSDASGVFSYTQVQDGRYSLLISAPGFADRRLQVDVVGGQPADLGRIALMSQQQAVPFR